MQLFEALVITPSLVLSRTLVTGYSDTPQRSRAPDNTNQYTHDIATTASDGHGDAGPGAEVELERQKIPTAESAVKLLGDCLLVTHYTINSGPLKMIAIYIKFLLKVSINTPKLALNDGKT